MSDNIKYPTIYTHAYKLRCLDTNTETKLDSINNFINNNYKIEDEYLLFTLLVTSKNYDQIINYYNYNTDKFIKLFLINYIDHDDFLYELFLENEFSILDVLCEKLINSIIDKANNSYYLTYEINDALENEFSVIFSKMFFEMPNDVDNNIRRFNWTVKLSETYPKIICLNTLPSFYKCNLINIINNVYESRYSEFYGYFDNLINRYNNKSLYKSPKKNFLLTTLHNYLCIDENNYEYNIFISDMFKNKFNLTNEILLFSLIIHENNKFFNKYENIFAKFIDYLLNNVEISYLEIYYYCKVNEVYYCDYDKFIDFFIKIINKISNNDVLVQSSTFIVKLVNDNTNYYGKNMDFLQALKEQINLYIIFSTDNLKNLFKYNNFISDKLFTILDNSSVNFDYDELVNYAETLISTRFENNDKDNDSDNSDDE